MTFTWSRPPANPACYCGIAYLHLMSLRPSTNLSMLLSPFRLLPIVSPSTKPRMFVRLCLVAGGQQTRDTVPLHLVSASPSINLNMLLLLYNSSRLHLSPPASGFPSCACDSFDVMKSPRCRLRDKLKIIYRKKNYAGRHARVCQIAWVHLKLGILPFCTCIQKRWNLVYSCYRELWWMVG